MKKKRKKMDICIPNLNTILKYAIGVDFINERSHLISNIKQCEDYLDYCDDEITFHSTRMNYFKNQKAEISKIWEDEKRKLEKIEKLNIYDSSQEINEKKNK
jgi:hypothetical protein